MSTSHPQTMEAPLGAPSRGTDAQFIRAYPGLAARIRADAAKIKAEFVRHCADKAMRARDCGDEFAAKTWADGATRAAREAFEMASYGADGQHGAPKGHEDRRKVLYYGRKAHAFAMNAGDNAEFARRCATSAANRLEEVRS